LPAAQTSPGRWTAGVIAGLLVLTPLLGWAGSLGFAPAVALAGLLTALSVRIRTEDRALLLALFTALVWACASAFWSPWRPADLDEQTGLKLVFMLALYGCAVSAARAVPEGRLPRLLSGLATAAGVLALFLLFEALTSAAGYKVLLGLIGQTVRPDYAIKNVAQGLYVLTLLAPPALAAVSGRTRWILGLVLGAGIIGPALVFGYDAPLLALACAILAAGLVLGLPSLGPRLLAGLSAGGFLLAPVLAKGAFALGLDERIAPLLSESWLQRLGYWGKAVDWIWARPLPGWGLDASRAFGPGIQLHPHNAPPDRSGRSRHRLGLDLLGTVPARPNPGGSGGNGDSGRLPGLRRRQFRRLAGVVAGSGRPVGPGLHPGASRPPYRRFEPFRIERRARRCGRGVET